MKKFKNVLLPAVIILIGTGAAFATNTAKKSDDNLEAGYYLDNSDNKCKNSRIDCTTEPGAICTWTDPSTSITYSLHSFVNETMCDDNTLYSRQP